MTTQFRFSKIEVSWNVIIVIVTSFLALVIPANLVFHFELFGQLEMFFWLSSFILFLDILFNIYKYSKSKFDPIFEEPGTLPDYLKTWFVIDLLACLPIENYFPSSIFQLLQLIKLVKVGFYMSKWSRKQIKYGQILTIFFFFYWASLAAHWLACGWLSLRGLDPKISDISNYIIGIYWTVTTLTTIGYGDITPVNDIQRLFTIFVEIVGVGFYSLLIGNIAGLISKRDPAKQKYSENLEKLSILVRTRDIPDQLQKKIRDYYTYIWKNRLGYDENVFVEGLPTSLQHELSMSLKKELIERIPLFKDADINFIRETASTLKTMICIPGQILFNVGSIGNEMYFVVNGELEVYDDKFNKPIAVLKQGDFFGEIALFMNVPRTATIISKTYSDLYILEKAHFDYIIAKYPEIGAKIERKAIFRNRMNISLKEDEQE
ncbi:MAG: cyclic nucleotide-binding domain-containing protein [Ignavibacteriales bacterium]|nr:cyclic nucleotide-binding domain-containing protein [Ignavibacteriales bacterium]MCF8438180.1 cyclic nucleotide-binding domain-containing protein [Ignavibacteriales bacterium]